jgi:RNA recognition motif-containing protein
MNIYVAQFDAQMQDDQLKALFTPFGEVQSAKVEIDVFTNQSRGFGYVEMPDEEQAQAAISGLHETVLNGRSITVQPAKPKEIKRGSYKVGDGGVNPYRFKKN